MTDQTSAPMTQQEIDEIRAAWSIDDFDYNTFCEWLFERVPALLAEVERQNAETKRLQALLDSMKSKACGGCKVMRRVGGEL